MSHIHANKPSYHRPCTQHPTTQSSSAFCATCLRERLSTVIQPPQTLTLNTINKTLISASATSLSELRRSKSFSCSNVLGGSQSSGVEPKRKSCDVNVRARNTLWSLFEEEGISVVNVGVGDRIDEEGVEEIRDSSGELRLVDGFDVVIRDTDCKIGEERGEIERVEVVLEKEEDLKTVKDLIDLDLRGSMSNKASNNGGGFWSAASKKLQKWKFSSKKRNGGSGIENGNNGKLVDTLGAMGTFGTLGRKGRLYSEAGENGNEEEEGCGLRRRSCDVDMGNRNENEMSRRSFDNPRYSVDEPRASCDGYLNFRPLPRVRVPPMKSVVEDLDLPSLPVIRTVVVEDGDMPGGLGQTRDYYSDTLQRRRRSFDQSNLKRNRLSEYDDIKSMIPNAKVSPVSNYHFQKSTLFSSDMRSRNSNSDSVKDDCHVGVGDMDLKKSRHWKNIWGLMSKANAGKHEGKFRDFRSGENRRVVNGVLRRNGSVGSHCSLNLVSNVHAKKSREGVLIERNRSARFSPTHLDNNGLLRFYLTPLRRSRTTKSSSSSSHSFARSIFGFTERKAHQET